VRVTTAARTQLRDVKAGASYLSQSDLRVHVGLGAAMIAERIDLHWPSGRIDTIRNVQANQIVTIDEGAGITSRAAFSR
jgi:hypothetical protein